MIDMIQGAAKAVFGDKGIVGSVVDILKSTGVMKDPEQELKVTQALMAYEIKMAEFEAQQAVAVNATMQAEAKSEHWAQWLWRPTIGFSFAGMIVNNYVLLPYLGKWITPIEIPTDIVTAILAILGIASLGRSSTKAGWFGKKVEK